MRNENGDMLHFGKPYPHSDARIRQSFDAWTAWGHLKLILNRGSFPDRSDPVIEGQSHQAEGDAQEARCESTSRTRRLDRAIGRPK